MHFCLNSFLLLIFERIKINIQSTIFFVPCIFTINWDNIYTKEMHGFRMKVKLIVFESGVFIKLYGTFLCTNSTDLCSGMPVDVEPSDFWLWTINYKKWLHSTKQVLVRSSLNANKLRIFVWKPHISIGENFSENQKKTWFFSSLSYLLGQVFIDSSGRTL